MLAYRPDPSAPGTFMMVLTPGLDLRPLTGGADYVFILDVSGPGPRRPAASPRCLRAPPVLGLPGSHHLTIRRSAAGWPAPALTVSLAAIAAAVAAVPALPEALQYERSAVEAGQWWRLLTGHLVHWNLDHLAWDLGVFCLLGTLCERRDPRACAACLGTAAAAISLWLWRGAAAYETYRGLSGIDAALFGMLVMLLLADCRAAGDRRRAALVLVFAAGFVAKIAWEITMGETAFVQSAGAGFVPVPTAHVIGAMVGVAVALCRSAGAYASGRSGGSPVSP